jgi:hypothetical protein
VIVARAWGCTPAQLRDVTAAEYAVMVELLLEQQRHAEQQRS